MRFNTFHVKLLTFICLVTFIGSAGFIVLNAGKNNSRKQKIDFINVDLNKNVKSAHLRLENLQDSFTRQGILEEKYYQSKTFSLINKSFDGLFNWLKQEQLLLRNQIKSIQSEFIAGYNSGSKVSIRRVSNKIKALSNYEFFRIDEDKRFLLIRKLVGLSGKLESFVNQVSLSKNSKLYKEKQELKNQIKRSIQNLNLTSRAIISQGSQISQSKSYFSKTDSMFVLLGVAIVSMMGLIFGIYASSKGSRDFIGEYLATQESENSENVTIASTVHNNFISDESLAEAFKESTVPTVRIDDEQNLIWANDEYYNIGTRENFQTFINNFFTIEEDDYTTFEGLLYRVVETPQSNNEKWVQFISVINLVDEFNTLVGADDYKVVYRKISQNIGYQVNDFVSNILIKMNFIFQVSGTVINFKPLDEKDIKCYINSDMLEKVLVKMIKAVNKSFLAKQIVDELSISLKNVDDRLKFEFFIPGITFDNYESSDHTLRDLFKEFILFEKYFSGLGSRVQLTETENGVGICLSLENTPIDYSGAVELN